MSSLSGTTLGGRYRLEDRIGSGGMSTVYRAVDETLERYVAVKVMNAAVRSDSDQLERFRREAKAVAQLSHHPHVVGVIDAGEDDGQPYIVFEYVEGETLKDRVRRLGRLPISEAVAYAIEIARALGAAHSRHIVHRDVKPQNVLIDEQGSAKVTDFGIARTLDEDGLTADGRVIGTTDYVSPEQAMGEPVTGQSDLYSLGIVLFEMLCGEVPFKGENQVAVAMKHVREEIPDIRVRRPEVSVALATVIDRATDKDPRKRYPTDKAMIADLEEVLAIETTRAGHATGQTTAVLRTLPRRTRRRVPLSIRHRTLAAVGAVVVLVVIAVIAVVLISGAKPGSGTHKHSAGTGTTKLVTLCSTCAYAYNPDGSGGQVTQNNSSENEAIDGDAGTAWTTENYYYGAGSLGKPGVGIYVKLTSATAIGGVKIVTTTPGFTAKIYGSTTTPDAESFSNSGWVKLDGPTVVSKSGELVRVTDRSKYKYFLLWITRLPTKSQNASINELSLYR